MLQSKLRQISRNIGMLVLIMACGCQGEVPKSNGTGATKSDATEPAAVFEAEVPETPFELESGFQLLSRDDFDAFAAEPETWTATADGVSCTGKPRGYLYSKLPCENFTWRLDYRFPRPKSLKEDSKFKGNTGFLVYITGEQKLWPVCIEVQGKFIQMAAIKENGGADPVMVDDDEAAREKARNAVGKWNSLEIISKSGALAVSLNGTAISSAKSGPLMSGLIGIQAEDHPFEVRRMRIRKDD